MPRLFSTLQQISLIFFSSFRRILMKHEAQLADDFNDDDNLQTTTTHIFTRIHMYVLLLVAHNLWL